VALLLVSADTNILDLVRSAELADSELASQRDSLLELSLPQRHQQASPSLRLVAKMLSESGIEVDEIAANCLAELGDDRKKAFSALRRRCKM
jgi:hypothetical protein